MINRNLNFDSLMGRITQLSEDFQRATSESRAALERECAVSGHRYRVHGKTSPTRVSCGRCEETWDVSARKAS